ncbi:ABC-type transporter, integral membrane subunit [Caldalkalibacillus thermarum TA2.A1]|uniref:ABC-type transporter, integral membrane subunit n=2 Tax=Caldalkalibacillus TaxID=379065 RepID=F5L6I1_CALTT|nr:branched-chain amino acid ABC transporter permease [Caldalkalibacillus thermarum]EGL83042.1 ABC-type transporter, integral membrane subunit [Caldalkalibacillus thermarum TA2.A1]QZT33565.1 branched-chain amino acid ABC transporter permease [Caldalkalibacillus thermarum TA2.A1]
MAGQWHEKWLTKRNGIIVLLLIALLFPVVIDNQYYLQVIIKAIIFSIAVYGLNIIAGYTGQLNLAHAGFFAIGAYSVGLLTVKAGLNYWLALGLALVITTVLGLVIGLIALRTTGHFFAIYTLCVGYIIYLIIYKWDEFTGGVRGLIGIPAPAPLGPLSFNTLVSQYYLTLFFLIITIFVIYRLSHSLLGRTFVAIRNSEELAQTIGVNTMTNKLTAFVLSTFFAGLAGGLYASFIRFLGPEISYVVITFDMVMYLLVGGIGTLAGPVIGTVLVTVIVQSLQFLEDYRMLVFGPVLVLLIVFYPRGLVGGYLEWKIKRDLKRKSEQMKSGGRDRTVVQPHHNAKLGS